MGLKNNISIIHESGSGGKGFSKKIEKRIFTSALFRKKLWALEPAKKVIKELWKYLLSKDVNDLILSSPILFHGIGAVPLDIEYFIKVALKKRKGLKLRKTHICITDYDIDLLERGMKYLAKQRYLMFVKEARVASSVKLPYNENMFEIAVSTGVYHHINELEEQGAVKALKEIKRVLKPGGLLIIASEPLNNLGVIGKVILKKFSNLSGSEFKRNIRKTGFRIINSKYKMGHIGIIAINSSHYEELT